MTRYRRNAAVRETTLEAETFLVDAEGREVYYLDAVTSGLWRLLAEPQTLEFCCDTYLAAFPEEPRARIVADVERAIAELEGRGLIVRVP